MVKDLVLFDKIYNISKSRGKEDIFLRYLKYLNERVKGFPDTSLKIKKLRDFDKRFEIEISGPEEVFVYNLLKNEIGSITEFSEIKEKQNSELLMRYLWLADYFEKRLPLWQKDNKGE